jgi:Tol biopolymer transport system component
MIDITGENLTSITDTPDIADYGPRWSPVEDKILFVSRNSGKDELWTIMTDGSELTQVSDSKSPVTEGEWSPDGKRIAFAYGGFGKTELYVVDPDGKSNVVQLTNNKATNQNPAWSPDGSQIVFASNVSGKWDLWLINADGTGLTQLTNDDFQDVYPDWCPK